MNYAAGDLKKPGRQLVVLGKDKSRQNIFSAFSAHALEQK